MNILKKQMDELYAKAAFIRNFNSNLNIEKISPSNIILNSDEVLIRVYACGLCYTDIHAIDGDWDTKPKLPLVPGHEGVGIIVDIGAEARNILSLGDRVGLSWLFLTCKRCEFCLSGWETLCTSQKNTGYSTDGCMSDYAVAKATSCILIPKEISFVQAAPLLCAGVTSYKGLKETEVKPGEFVSILGAAGGLGHLAVQYAKAMGMRVIAMDVGKEKLDYCKRLGAEFTVDASQADVIDQVNTITDGGSHGVLCLATNKAAFSTAVKIARRKGTAVLVGLPNETFECPINDVILKRITIRGSIVGTRKDMYEALDFAARGLVKCDVELLSLDDINLAVSKLRESKVQGRIVIQFQPEQVFGEQVKKGN